MTTFPHPGKENTNEALSLAVDYAKAHDLDLVLATCTGATVQAALAMAAEKDYKRPLVAVTHVYGMAEPGGNELPEDLRRELAQQGVRFVTAAHALSGGERGLSKRFGGVNPVELVAHGCWARAPRSAWRSPSWPWTPGPSPTASPWWRWEAPPTGRTPPWSSPRPTPRTSWTPTSTPFSASPGEGQKKMTKSHGGFSSFFIDIQ